MKIVAAVLAALVWGGLVAAQTLTQPGPGLGSGGISLLIASQSLTDTSGLTTIESRNVIASAALASISGTKVQVTLVPNSTTTMSIDLAYIGMKGAAAPNYDGGQKQLLFGGSASVTLTGGGPVIFSDLTTFTYTSGHDLVVCLQYHNTPSPYSAAQNAAASASFTVYKWIVVQNCAATTPAAADSNTPNEIRTVGAIYVQ